MATGKNSDVAMDVGARSEMANIRGAGNLKRVLVPTDFSRSAENACVVANRLAEAFGGAVDLLHVIPTLTYFRESIKTLGIPFDMDGDFYPRIQKESEHRLREIMTDYIHERHRGEVHVVIDRRASDGITSFAEQHDVDLIVVGARGSDQTTLLRGSTSERVIRRSRIPVLTVNDAFEWVGVKRILVPTDGSDDSLDALDMALDLAGPFGGAIRLFHVMELHGSEHVTGMQGLRTSGSEPTEGIRHALVERLARRHPETVASGSTGGWVFHGRNEGSMDVALDVDIIRGVSAHDEIERQAEDWADLVVMATHGLGGLARFVLGSTAETVAANLRKPLLTVRPASLAPGSGG
jgi:nucleotide-binding universal stress UspA family protein